ncbi:hypothetical protein BGW80DRAFT_1300213 [Lactifluus volemus]|nr:hypothetical protein BGW80DRAFT_1300213 [Lactifluus volemus]
MANSIRSETSARNWSASDLLAHNITVQCQSAPDFFGSEPGSIDHIDPDLLLPTDLSFSSTTANLSDDAYRFLAHLYLASHEHPCQKSTIVDLSRSILDATGFCERDIVSKRDHDIPHTFCGYRTTRADVCLFHFTSHSILLVVQVECDETTTNSESADPVPQVIAEAIATFQYNNRKRAASGLPILDTMTVPCISMVGTKPTFYLVPVTSQLSTCVISGLHPSHPTVVQCCPLPSQLSVFKGMEVLDYRRTALQYFDAFRDLARVNWTKFIDGYVKIGQSVSDTKA